MRKNDMKAFTLIELLAVIVILAIIALIATPIILNIIEKARKSAFQDTAYGLIETARLQYTEGILDGDYVSKTYTAPFNDLTFSGSKPNGGTIIVGSDGKIAIAIHNNKWCAVKGAEDSTVQIIKYEEGNCVPKDSAKDPIITLNGEKEISLKPGEVYTELGATGKTVDGQTLDYVLEIIFNGTKVESIDTTQLGEYQLTYQVTSNGKTVKVKRIVKIEIGPSIEKMMENAEIGDGTIRTDQSKNKRYAGSNPNNYVCFGKTGEVCDENHLYRIIGIFNGQAKIIKKSPYNTMAWDTSGSNDWDRPATLNTELNSTGFYQNPTYIEEIYRGYIVNATWWIGWPSTVMSTLTLSDYESAEKTKSTKGEVGLITVTDLVYASNDTNCKQDTPLHIENSACMSRNWIFDGSPNGWTMVSNTLTNTHVGVIRPGGYFTSTEPIYYNSVHPVLYLNSDVKVVSRTGTIEAPYQLSR